MDVLIANLVAFGTVAVIIVGSTLVSRARDNRRLPALRAMADHLGFAVRRHRDRPAGDRGHYPRGSIYYPLSALYLAGRVQGRDVEIRWNQSAQNRRARDTYVSVRFNRDLGLTLTVRSVSEIEGGVLGMFGSLYTKVGLEPYDSHCVVQTLDKDATVRLLSQEPVRRAAEDIINNGLSLVITDRDFSLVIRDQVCTDAALVERYVNRLVPAVIATGL